MTAALRPLVVFAGAGDEPTAVLDALARRGIAPHPGLAARPGRRVGPLLAAAHRLAALLPTDDEDPRLPALLATAADALADTGPEPWVWAAPEVTRTLRWWLPLFDAVGARLVVAVGDPAALVPGRDDPYPEREVVVSRWAADLEAAVAALDGRRVRVVDLVRRTGRLPAHLGFAAELREALVADPFLRPGGVPPLPTAAADLLALRRGFERDVGDLARQLAYLGIRRGPAPLVPDPPDLPDDPWAAAEARERRRWTALLAGEADRLRRILDLPGGPPASRRRRLAPAPVGGPPVHVCTVHWLSPQWIDAQAAALDRWLPPGSRRLAVLSGIDRGWADRFDVVLDVAGSHAERLGALARRALEDAGDDDLLLFLDGDALPVGPVGEALLAGAPLAAVRRDENLGDRAPHPCFCLVRAGLWRALDGDWREGPTWRNAAGEDVTDVGGRLLEQLDTAGVPWTPLLRSNRVEHHPLWFGVYGDVAYHHGAAFRVTYSRADLQARADATRPRLVPPLAPFAPLVRVERGLRRRATDRRFERRRDRTDRLGAEIGAVVRAADDPGVLFGLPPLGQRIAAAGRDLTAVGETAVADPR